MNSLLAVEGMFCAGCARSLERQLVRLPSVDRAQVSLQAGCLWVEWREQPCLDELEARAAKMGYRILPIQQSLLGQNPFRLRMTLSVFFTMWVMMASAPFYLGFELEPAGQALLASVAIVLSLPVTIYCAWPFFRMAWSNARVGRLGSDFQIAGSTLACLALSLVDWPHVYVEGSCVLVSASLLARQWEAESARDAREILAGILGKTSDSAGCQASKGQETEWTEGLVLGVDGVVVAGAGLVDESLLSGESLPVTVVVGDSVWAGSRLLHGPLRIRVTSEPGRRRLDQWLLGMSGASARKGSWESWTERAIVPWNLSILSLFLALVGAGMLGFLGWPLVGRRLLLVATAACPCAFSLAVPLLMRRLRSESNRRRIHFRDLRALQELSAVRTWIFDKTGTLTQGRPRLVEVQCEGDASTWGLLAARLSFAQPHPLGQALRQAFPLQSSDPKDEVFLVPGKGVTCPELQAFLGSCEWILSLGFPGQLETNPVPSACDLVYQGRWRARFLFEDRLRPGIENLPGPRWLCSGDHPRAVADLVDSTGLRWEAVWSGQSPEEKLARLESCGPATAYVGDGINDVLVLSGASPGISLGYSCASAIEAASVVVDDLAGVGEALRLARWFRGRARMALVCSFAYNALLLPAAVSGWLDPGWTAAAMGCSSLAVVLVASNRPPRAE